VGSLAGGNARQERARRAGQLERTPRRGTGSPRLGGGKIPVRRVPRVPSNGGRLGGIRGLRDRRAYRVEVRNVIAMDELHPCPRRAAGAAQRTLGARDQVELGHRRTDQSGADVGLQGSGRRRTTRHAERDSAAGGTGHDQTAHGEKCPPATGRRAR